MNKLLKWGFVMIGAFIASNGFCMPNSSAADICFSFGLLIAVLPFIG